MRSPDSATAFTIPAVPRGLRAILIVLCVIAGLVLLDHTAGIEANRSPVYANETETAPPSYPGGTCTGQGVDITEC